MTMMLNTSKRAQRNLAWGLCVLKFGISLPAILTGGGNYPAQPFVSDLVCDALNIIMQGRQADSVSLWNWQAVVYSQQAGWQSVADTGANDGPLVCLQPVGAPPPQPAGSLWTCTCFHTHLGGAVEYGLKTLVGNSGYYLSERWLCLFCVHSMWVEHIPSLPVWLWSIQYLWVWRACCSYLYWWSCRAWAGVEHSHIWGTLITKRDTSESHSLSHYIYIW